MPNTTTPSMMGRVWAITNAYEDTITLNAGSSGALFNGTDQTFDIRSGRQIQVTLIDITGIGVIWGLGSLLPVPSSGGAIGVGDILAGSNITLTPSADNQQITISASGSGGGGTSDHGGLTGLSDDDHVQYAKSLTAIYINSNSTLSSGPGLYIVNNQSTVTLPGTLTSALYGRSYYIRNNDAGSITIFTGSSGAVFEHDSSSSFNLEPYKEAKVTLVNISGTGNVWVVNNIVPAINSGGALGVNDLQFGPGFGVSSPENDILPLSIGFSTNAAAEIPFAPANAAHWPTQPTTVGEALNSLAARANALGG
jgi:urease beta subunit